MGDACMVFGRSKRFAWVEYAMGRECVGRGRGGKEREMGSGHKGP